MRSLKFLSGKSRFVIQPPPKSGQI